MLFPFLSELNRDIFDRLPWDMQRKIADFCPNLPPINKRAWEIFHVHTASRYCGHCGKILPRWNEKFYCLCRHRHNRQKYHPPTRPFKTYRRPSHVFDAPDVCPLEFAEIEYHVPEWSDVLLASNQQEYVYRFIDLFHKSDARLRCLITYYDNDLERVARKYMEKRINTHTCLRSFLDRFVVYLEGETLTPAVEYHECLGRRFTQNTLVLNNYFVYHKTKPSIVEFPFSQRRA